MMKWETKFLSSETVSISQRFAQEQWKLMNTKDLSELQAYKACEQKFRNEIEQFEINVCGHFEQLKDEDHVATGYGKDDLALGEANMKHLKRNISTDSITPEQSARLATELSKEPPSLTSLLEPPPLSKFISLYNSFLFTCSLTLAVAVTAFSLCRVK